MSDDKPFGYLMVHFVEDPDGYAEKIYLSLSRGEDPTRWYRLNGGEPVLASEQGTTGVRDPHLVRSPAGDRFYLVATDLRVFGGDDAGWHTWSHHGSRSIVIWETADLVTWSQGRLVEVAPENAGMAWAPEFIYDDERGEYFVFWSSNLLEDNDHDHTGPTHSRILYATTRDFVTFSPAQVYLDTGSTTIDTTMIRHAGKVFRFHKDNDPGGRQRDVSREPTLDQWRRSLIVAVDLRRRACLSFSGADVSVDEFWWGLRARGFWLWTGLVGRCLENALAGCGCARSLGRDAIRAEGERS